MRPLTRVFLFTTGALGFVYGIATLPSMLDYPRRVPEIQERRDRIYEIKQELENIRDFTSRLPEYAELREKREKLENELVAVPQDESFNKAEEDYQVACREFEDGQTLSLALTFGSLIPFLVGLAQNRNRSYID